MKSFINKVITSLICFSVYLKMMFMFIDAENWWALFFTILLALPYVFLIFPLTRNMGLFAFIRVELKREPNETSKYYYLRVARNWFLASLIFPLSLGMIDICKEYENTLIAILFGSSILGLVFICKGFENIYKAFKKSD